VIWIALAIVIVGSLWTWVYSRAHEDRGWRFRAITFVTGGAMGFVISKWVEPVWFALVIVLVLSVSLGWVFSLIPTKDRWL
jgi:lipoprotein signal peptidase